MRRPADIPGLDPDLLKRFPADSLRALGERLGVEDARAGARVSPEYLRYAFHRVSLARDAAKLTADEIHALCVGLVLGVDALVKET